MAGFRQRETVSEVVANMIKAMLFVDGTWLYYGKGRLAAPEQEDFNLDYGKLPEVLAAGLSAQLGGTPVDVVRKCLFGSYAANYDPADEELAQRQRHFFTMLRERHHYDVDTYPVDFRGRPVRRTERAPEDSFAPHEKCVDLALASSMLYHAALPGCYDVAVAVLGDQDFVPLLRTVRRLGKRVALASIRDGCHAALRDPADAAGVRDFDVIWLDDHGPELELVFESQTRVCESPLHEGDRLVWTTYVPGPDEHFYCDACRAAYARQREREQERAVEAVSDVVGNAPGDGPAMPGQTLGGRVKTVIQERGFGFIHGNDGQDYFFHLTDLGDGLDFERLESGVGVVFVVRRTPEAERAGAARNVCAWNP